MNKNNILAVDVGATKILIGTISSDGVVIKKKSYKNNISCETAVKDCIRSSVKDYLENEWQGQSPAAAGFGVFGQVDHKNGVWLGSMRISGMSPLDIRNEMHVSYGIKTNVDNDVHCATLAEMYLGKGSEYSDFVYVNVGTGISAGIVSDRRLIRGAANYSGEIGHLYIGETGIKCMCGRTTCLEPVASGGGMIECAKSWLYMYPDSVLAKLENGNGIKCSEIFDAAESGDPLGRRIFDNFVRGLGIGLTGLLDTFNPEALILGGGVLGDKRVMEPLKEFVLNNCLKVVSSSLKEIAESTLGVHDVGLLGAACLAKQALEDNF